METWELFLALFVIVLIFKALESMVSSIIDFTKDLLKQSKKKEPIYDGRNGNGYQPAGQEQDFIPPDNDGTGEVDPNGV